MFLQPFYAGERAPIQHASRGKPIIPADRHPRLHDLNGENLTTILPHRGRNMNIRWRLIRGSLALRLDMLDVGFAGRDLKSIIIIRGARLWRTSKCQPKSIFQCNKFNCVQRRLNPYHHNILCLIKSKKVQIMNTNHHFLIFDEDPPIIPLLNPYSRYEWTRIFLQFG